MKPPGAAKHAVGIDQIKDCRSASERRKRTTFMDAAFFTDQKQEETSRREKETVLAIESILLPSKGSREKFLAQLEVIQIKWDQGWLLR